MADIVEYKLNIEQALYTEETPTYTQNVTQIPNQAWKGYYNEEVFNSNQDKPSGAQYVDFGISVWYYGCAVCSCIGASNLLNNANYTIYDAYKKDTFKWNSSIVNGKGIRCGATLAKWNTMTRIGIRCNSLKMHYDDQRQYAWAGANSKLRNPSVISGISLYVPSDESIQYNQGGGVYTKGNRNALLSQTNYCAYQAAGLYRIEGDIAAGKCDVVFICSSKKNCGHWVLATGYQHQHGGTVYSTDDVTVYDPCPANHSKLLYAGKQTTLTDAMKRIGADISDGVRSILTITKA